MCDRENSMVIVYDESDPKRSTTYMIEKAPSKTDIEAFLAIHRAFITSKVEESWDDN